MLGAEKVVAQPSGFVCRIRQDMLTTFTQFFFRNIR
jgi:hypothetical protein